MIIGYCRKSRISEADELTRQEHLVVEYCKNKGYKLDKLTRLNRLFLLGNITEQELQEYSREYKDNIALLSEKLQRLESYSLFKVTQELQGRIVVLEELHESNDMSSLVKLVDYVQYYKDSAGLSVKTVFRDL